MSPKTLGGAVISQYGIRTWWHVQRCLIAWGTGIRTLGRVPSHRELGEIAYGGATATLSRDMAHFKKVFGDESPAEVWERIEAGRVRSSVSDVVMTAVV